MNLHKHNVYVLEQHINSFKIWSATIRINTEGKSMIIQSAPYLPPNDVYWCRAMSAWGTIGRQFHKRGQNFRTIH